MKKLTADLFSHAISALDFSKLESENSKKEHIGNLVTLGSSFYFKINDFLDLVFRMEKYFNELEKDMIEQTYIKNKKLIENTNNSYSIEYLNRKNQNDILNIKDFIKSQLDTVGLGVLLRVHAYLEEVLKKICQIINGIFSIGTTYENMNREGRFSKDSISIFEKCVIYIDKSPLNTKVNLYEYDLLFEWNKVRNNLVHNGGDVSEIQANEFKDKLGLQTFKDHSQRLVYNTADMSLIENTITEKPLRIQLSFPDIVGYILIIDNFLATLINPNINSSFIESQKIKDIALNTFEDEERFKEVFTSTFEQIKNNKNIAELIGVSKIDEEYEEYLMESLKLLLNDSR